jgi:hypothetical protein
MPNPSKAPKPRVFAHGSIKETSTPKFGKRKGHIYGMTTRGSYPTHEVIFFVEYNGKKYKRKLHESKNTQWVIIDNKPVQTNYPGR